MAKTKEAFFAELSRLSLAEVKTNIATNVYLSYPEKAWAPEWVERSNEATSAEQLLLARSAAANAEAALEEAREANNIARSARRIAMVSVASAAAIAIVAVIVQHYWH